MNTYIGIDLGTSAVKLLLVAENGEIVKTVTKTYPINYPHSGWSEQNPEDWYEGVAAGIQELLDGQDCSCVKGIGCGGQMHGLVVLDREDNVIRPAILWNDGRTQTQTEYLNEVVGKETLSKYTANIAFAGFTAPKILWLKENEPQNFARIEKIMLPKDYIVYRLCGVHATDYSDASGTLFLDVENRRWSREMCTICGVEEKWLPKLYESYEKVGTIHERLANEWGISSSTVVCAGAGDNAAAAIGTGTVKDGDCNLSLGTSGTAFIVGDRFSVDKQNALHSFCHANGKYHLMGCILSAASCNQWWMAQILETQAYGKEQEGLDAYMGANNVFFLPYLMGERSPHNDVNATGAFIGMRPDTTRGQMTLAVLEGVAFALRDCIEVAKGNGIRIGSVRMCGGGAKSELWRNIMTNVLNIPVQTVKIEEGPAYGGAILAMVASGAYSSVQSATDKLVRYGEKIFPNVNIAKAYQDKYDIFKKLYPCLRDIYKEMKGDMV